MENYDLNDPTTRDLIQNSFDNQDYTSLLDIIRSLHPADQAKLFDSLKSDQQEILLKQMEIPEIADIFDELDDRQTLDAAQNLPLPFLAYLSLNTA